MDEFTSRTILEGEDPFYPQYGKVKSTMLEDVPQVEDFDDLSAVILKPLETGVARKCYVREEFEGWKIDEIILFDNRPVVVLERNLEEQGLFVFADKEGIIARIKKSIGMVCSPQIRHEIRYPQDYFKRIADSGEDVLAKMVLALLEEPTYTGLVDLLPPLANPYHFLRHNEEPYRLIVQWDGSIPGCFDHNLWYSNYVDSPPIFDSAVEIKRGLVGGYLPAIDFGYYDERRDIGWEEIAFTYEDEELRSHLLIRVRVYAKGKIEDCHFSEIPSKQSSDSGTFYWMLLKLKLKWDEFLSNGTEVHVGETRVNDAYRAGLIMGMENFEGREWPRKPKYGSGRYAKREHNTFPPATTAVTNCLLDWGFTREAKDVVRYYLTNYVRCDGTFRYYGPSPDEYGQMLETVARCYLQTNDCVWVEELHDPIERIAGHVIDERERSKKVNAPESIYHGLILGILEADYCRKPPVYNYSNDAWCWRGLHDMGKVLVEVGEKNANKAMTDFGRRMLREATEYREDILASIHRTYNNESKPSFLPVIVGTERPYSRMNIDTDASYANYHLYPDLLYAGFLDEEKAKSIIRFRENRGGELLGMTRFAEWIDDWPATGYGWALTKFDFIEKVLLLYYAHMAHHQNRGTFLAYEQVDFVENQGTGRLVRADHCIPATLVVPHLTRLMLVFEERDDDIVWLNKSAPRLWFEDEKKIIVKDAVTRFGKISYIVSSKIAQKLIVTQLVLPNEGFKAEILLRLRPPEGHKFRRVELNGEEWPEFDTEREFIRIPKRAKGKIEVKTSLTTG